MPKPIDVEMMRLLFDYDSETGVLVRRTTQNPRNANSGARVGSVDSKGYLFTVVSRKRLYVHRIAWAMHYGKSPILDIDHINGNVTDNRIVNLRETSRSLNLQNQRRAHRDSKSGYLGVHPAYGGKWKARIYAHGQLYELGIFSDPKVAHQHYLAAKRMLHPGCRI